MDEEKYFKAIILPLPVYIYYLSNINYVHNLGITNIFGEHNYMFYQTYTINDHITQ